MSEPRTPSGRALLTDGYIESADWKDYLRDRILAIEREAAAAALPDVAELAAALRQWHWDNESESVMDFDASAAAILAELSRARR